MRARALPSEAILEIGWCRPRRKSNYMKCVIKVISFEWGGIVITYLLLIWDLGI